MNLLKRNQIPSSDIKYLESDSNYTFIHTKWTEQILSAYSLGVLYRQLDKKKFYRANRQLVFNLDYVEDVWHEGDHAFVALTEGKLITLSRRRTKLFKQFLKNHYKNKFRYRYPNKGAFVKNERNGCVAVVV